MTVIEMKGNNHVFTLADNSTFRIFARECKQIADNKVSDELRTAEKMGFVSLVKDTPKPKKAAVEVQAAAKKEG